VVKAGHKLIERLEKRRIPINAALWVVDPDTKFWRLWLFPAAPPIDKHDFYRSVSEIMSADPEIFTGMDAADTEFVSDNHPAISALRTLLRTEKGSIVMRNNIFNGYYLPDSIVLRMNFPDRVPKPITPHNP